MNGRIKELRKALGLTQEEFGKRIGITKSSISTIESGRNYPSEQSLRYMCREYGVSYVWLTTGSSPMFEDGDDVALHVMVDTIMASENDRVKDVFKSLGSFTADDWHQVDQLLDKLLAGQQPWADLEDLTKNKKD